MKLIKRLYFLYSHPISPFFLFSTTALIDLECSHVPCAKGWHLLSQIGVRWIACVAARAHQDSSTIWWSFARVSFLNWGTKTSPTPRDNPFLRIITLVSKLRNHWLDVSECAICSINSSLILLSCMHLNLNLLPCLLCKLLHVSLNKVNLGIEIRVSLLGILNFLLQLEISQLMVLDSPLVLFLFFSEDLVLFRKLTQF